MPFRSKDKKRIIDNVSELSEKTKDFPALTSILKNKDVLTQEEIEKINTLSGENDYVRNHTLYELIVKKPEAGYKILLEALRETGQDEMANLIGKPVKDPSKIQGFFNKFAKANPEPNKDGVSESNLPSSRSAVTADLTDDTTTVAHGSNQIKNDKPKSVDHSENDIADDSALSVKSASATGDAGSGEKEVPTSVKVGENVGKEEEESPCPDDGEKGKEKKKSKGGAGGEEKEKKSNSMKKLTTNFVKSLLKWGASELDESAKEKLSGMRSKENLKKLQASFKHYDKDNSGSIGVEEFHELMKEYNFTPEEVDHILQMNDTDGDGEIDYFEFVAMFLPS